MCTFITLRLRFWKMQKHVERRKYVDMAAKNHGSRELRAGLGLKAPDTLPEDADLIPSTYMLSHNHL